MAYSVTYGQADFRFGQASKQRTSKFKIATALFCAILILIVWIVTPIRTAVLDFLLPGDGQTTRRASEQFLGDLKNGHSIKNAFSAFCIEIVENAQY